MHEFGLVVAHSIISSIQLARNIDKTQKIDKPLNQHLYSVPVFLVNMNKGKMDNVSAYNVRYEQKALTVLLR